jgi:hypothetical protein
VADPCAAGLCAVPLDCACVEDGTPMCLDEKHWHSAITAYDGGDQRWPKVRAVCECVCICRGGWVDIVVSFGRWASEVWHL